MSAWCGNCHRNFHNNTPDLKHPAGQAMGVTMATEPRSDLEVLAGMAERGEIRTVIDRIHPLEETAAGLAHVEAGHARGKVIIELYNAVPGGVHAG